MEESVTATREVFAARDASEALAIAAAHAQPTAAKVQAYRRHLSGIAAETQVDMSKTAEQHVPETSRTAAALADEVARRTSEENEKSTQRQREVMEKLSHPLLSRGEEAGQIQVGANQPVLQQSGRKPGGRVAAE
jgi:phasin family protein